LTQHRDLNYGDRFPEAVTDALQQFISTLLVNLRLILLNPTTVRIPAGGVNDQVGAGIMGRWRYVTANVDAAHPGGAAGQYDVFLTASDNVFVPSGNPPGQTPEFDNTVYTFAMQIRTQGTTPTTALYRKIAEVTWDGAAITRITMLAGNAPLSISDVVVVAPETATRNTIRPTGDFPALRLQRHADADAGDLWQVLDAAGIVIARVTHDGIVTPASIPTVTRDAIPAGRRPPGGIFFNPTSGRHETNVGTDAAPIWTGVGGFGPGVSIDFMGPETMIPPRTAPEDGRYLDKVGEPGLWNVLSGGGGGINPWDTFGGLPAPPAGKYRVPDLRGRGTIGKKDMGTGNASTPVLTGTAITRTLAATLGALLGEEFHALTTAEIPSVSGTTTVESVGHIHSGTTAGDSNDHGHGYSDPGHSHRIRARPALSGPTASGLYADDAANYPTDAAFIGISIGGVTAFHTHGFSTSSPSSQHVHSFSLGTGGGAHENVFPVAVVNKLITL
jgi:hypothetical protein